VLWGAWLGFGWEAIDGGGVSSRVLFPWIVGDSDRISDDLLWNQVFLPISRFSC